MTKNISKLKDEEHRNSAREMMRRRLQKYKNLREIRTGERVITERDRRTQKEERGMKMEKRERKTSINTIVGKG